LKVIDGPPIDPAQIVGARNAFADELGRLHERSPDLRRLEALLAEVNAA
jgi:hypothetical protein